jgi:tRNA G18 (ribose-2'-O)-methylase SpoU
MRVITIDNANDPRLAPYAGVREPARLRERGLLIAEGRFVVRRLLASPRVRFLSLLLNEAAARGLHDALAGADCDADVFVVSPAVMTEATGFNMHHGCLALAERPAPVALDTLTLASDFVVVLERVVDVDNVGAVFRNAEAFDADAVLLSPGCGDPFYRKAIRTSSGAALMVPFASAEPWPDALDELRANGFTIAALTPAADATDIGDFVRAPAARGKLALLLGSEGQGLTDVALARADVRLRIPISRALDSLNVATATGIALHRLEEARRR